MMSLYSFTPQVPTQGGHCYQQSELMFAALEHLGFNVTRVPCYVLLGKTFAEVQGFHCHNILLVVIDEQTYLCDPGFASASLRLVELSSCNAFIMVVFEEKFQYIILSLPQEERKNRLALE